MNCNCFAGWEARTASLFPGRRQATLTSWFLVGVLNSAKWSCVLWCQTTPHSTCSPKAQLAWSCQKAEVNSRSMLAGYSLDLMTLWLVTSVLGISVVYQCSGFAAAWQCRIQTFTWQSHCFGFILMRLLVPYECNLQCHACACR